MYNLAISSLEQGLAFALMALGVYLTFRILDFPDLTVDGSFPMGAAVTSIFITNGMNPISATLLSLIFGAAAGIITGILNTKLKITGLLAGILTMTALYSINLRIMGRSMLSLLREPTILKMVRDFGINRTYSDILVFLIIAVIFKILIDYFLHTEIGMAIRATGDNPQMIRSLGVNTDLMVILGLALANALVALSGALFAQLQGFADVGMGIGMIIMGLASVIIGESIIRSKKIIWATFGVIMGSFLYRLAVAIAYRLGLPPTDQKLITAALVIAALSAPALRKNEGWGKIKKLFGRRREASNVKIKEGSESIQPRSD